MKATIFLSDIGESSPQGGFNLRCEYESAHQQDNGTAFNPHSPSHQAARLMLKHLETQGEQCGQTVVKTTDEIVEMTADEKQARRELVAQAYEWLGLYKMQLPVSAVEKLQLILGPLPNCVNLDAAPNPERN